MKLSNIVIDGVGPSPGDIFKEPVTNDLVMIIKGTSRDGINAYNMVCIQSGSNYFVDLKTLEAIRYELASKPFKPVLSVTISKN